MTAALSQPGVAVMATDLIQLRHIAVTPGRAPPSAALPGGFSTRKRGHGQEMADVREYVSGDDVRHLDRGSTARTGVIHIRTFHEERDRATLLVADFRPSMLWGTRRAFRSVAAAEALALIGWRAVEEGGRVGLLALTADGPITVPLRGRVRGMLAVIGGLVRAHVDALEAARSGRGVDPPLSQEVLRVLRLAPVGAEIILASGFDHGGEGLAEGLGRVSRRRVLRLLNVMDGGIDQLPPGAYPIRLPDGSRRRIEADSAATPSLQSEIAGLPALRLDAGLKPEHMADVLAREFGSEERR